MKIKNIIKGIIPYAFIVFFVVLFRTFVATPVVVDGPSMDPTLKNGQLLILNKLPMKYRRYDIVVVKKEVNGKKERLIKRIIGMPGESVDYKHGKLYINNEIVKDKFAKNTKRFIMSDVYDKEKIPQDYYFVVGDNRDVSLDSRDPLVGLVSENDIIGRASFRIWPFNKIGTFSGM